MSKVILGIVDEPERTDVLTCLKAKAAPIVPTTARTYTAGAGIVGGGGIGRRESERRPESGL